MGAYAPNANLYNPRVLPDTQGYAPGIAAVGDAFAGALKTYATAKAGENRDKRDRAWQLDDRKELWGRQDARDLQMYGRQDAQRQELWGRQDARDLQMYGRQDAQRQELRAQELSDYAMRRNDGKADKEAERNRQTEDEIANYATTAGMYAQQGFVDKPQLDWAASRPLKEQPAAFKALADQGSFKAQQAIKTKMGQTWTDVPQGDVYKQNELNMIVPPKAAPRTGPTDEEIQKFGLQLQGYGPNGPVWGIPKPASPRLGQPGLVPYDQATGLPINKAAAPVAPKPKFTTEWKPTR